MADLNFVNRTLWTADNLDILRGMNSETIDLIYLDPPFNSNRNYAAPVGSMAAGAAFKDTWTLSDLDVAWIGLDGLDSRRTARHRQYPERSWCLAWQRYAVVPHNDGSPLA